MPDFSPNARARIIAATRRSEHAGLATTQDPPRADADRAEDRRLFELTTALVPGGEADAHPVVWVAGLDVTIPASTGGTVARKGGFVVNIAKTMKVRDIVGTVSGAVGERLWCHSIGTGLGPIWGVDASGGGGGGTIELRSFTLRTPLAVGGYAVAQQTEYRDFGTCEGSSQVSKKLCFSKDGNGDDVFFLVFDRLGEFEGGADTETKKYGCGMARKLSDTPTLAELCLAPIEGYEDVTDLWEIERITCLNFFGCPCQDPDVDPCEQVE